MEPLLMATPEEKPTAILKDQVPNEQLCKTTLSTKGHAPLHVYSGQNIVLAIGICFQYMIECIILVTIEFVFRKNENTLFIHHLPNKP